MSKRKPHTLLASLHMKASMTGAFDVSEADVLAVPEENREAFVKRKLMNGKTVRPVYNYVDAHFCHNITASILMAMGHVSNAMQKDMRRGFKYICETLEITEIDTRSPVEKLFDITEAIRQEQS